MIKYVCMSYAPKVMTQSEYWFSSPDPNQLNEEATGIKCS